MHHPVWPHSSAAFVCVAFWLPTTVPSMLLNWACLFLAGLGLDIWFLFKIYYTIFQQTLFLLCQYCNPIYCPWTGVLVPSHQHGQMIFSLLLLYQPYKCYLISTMNHNYVFLVRISFLCAMMRRKVVIGKLTCRYVSHQHSGNICARSLNMHLVLGCI